MTIPSSASSILRKLCIPAWPINAVRYWLDADGLRMSAAMSFYGMLSLAPLLVLLVALLGWWVDKSLVESNLLEQISAFTGPRVAEVASQALASTQRPSEGIVASLIAFALLLSGATGVFAELQTSFERVWLRGAMPGEDTERPAWWRVASLRLRGMAYVLVIGFLLLVSLVVSAVLGVVAHWAGQYEWLVPVLGVLNQLISIIFCTGLFWGLMRISAGQAKPALRYLAWGAFIGALLFALGKYAMAAYLAGAAFVSAYGAAGSLVVLLMWIYFSSAVLLFSASCARALEETAQRPSRAASTAPRPSESAR